MPRNQDILDGANALETLIHQFSDPLSFYRELIQNSVDAGSAEIDIRFEFREDDNDDSGVLIIRVDDFGEGMNRRIIDTKLTRLFSSSKDNDLTKIGRFGIGFVSVFAIQPDAVIVDTSRDGENWRVLFERDRSFVRIARDEPVEGTKIQIVKQMSRKDAKALRERSCEVVRFWCRYVEAEIRFAGQRINEPFDLEAACKVRHKEEGAEVVVGYPADATPSYGFYNKGLTLHEGRGKYFPLVAFKVSSRYLEHTLTRDNVLQDENFAKAMTIVTRIVRRDLPEKLLSDIESAVVAGAEPDSALYEILAHLVRTKPGGSAPVLDADAAFARSRRVFRSVTRGPVDLKTCRDALRREQLFIARQKSPLIAALEERGDLVLQIQAKGFAYAVLRAMTHRDIPRANRVYCLPRPAASVHEGRHWDPLRAAVSSLLVAHGAKFNDVHLAHFAYPGSTIEGFVAITQREPGAITEVEDIATLGTSFFSRRRHLTVNADHPTVDRLIRMAHHEPEFAAYTLVKLFFLRSKLTPEVDSRLAEAAWKQRCKRRNG